MTQPFADRLADAVHEKASCLVVGLDPVLERLPAAVLEGLDDERDPRRRAALAIARFDAAVLEAVAPYACAVKPQLAFYERWGPPGLEAYEQAVAAAHDRGLLVIADAKRGDIGSTAEAYARAFLTPEAPGATADAMTVNPLLGKDSLSPFLDAVRSAGAGLFVLVRTSNPSASEIQDLVADGHPIHEHLAGHVDHWGRDFVGESGFSSVGAVVGATAASRLERLRKKMPRAWLLLPGVGAQGATPEDVAAAFDGRGLGAVVNASRSVLYAFGDRERTDWTDAVGDAARSLRDDLRRVMETARRGSGSSRSPVP
jgi:orotidine-5'-phosphate decarboxylase